MIKSLIKLVLVLIIGILVYNYFLGTDTEKEQSRQVFDKGKELAKTVFDVVKTEKEKFDAGKYDNALEKIGDLFKDLKEKAADFGDQYEDRIANLDEKRKELERRLDDLKSEEGQQPKAYDNMSPKGEQQARRIEKELEKLMEKIDSLMEDMDKEDKSY